MLMMDRKGNEQMDRTFNILGEQISLTPKMEAMIELHKGFAALAQACCEDFYSHYFTRFKSYEELIYKNNLSKYISSYFIEALQLCAKDLKRFNVEITKNKVEKITAVHDGAGIWSVIEDLVESYNTLMNYQVQGNKSIGAAKTQAQVEQILKDAFENPATLSFIIDHLYEDICNFYFVTKDLINEPLSFLEKYNDYERYHYKDTETIYKSIVDPEAYLQDQQNLLNELLEHPAYTIEEARQTYQGIQEELAAMDVRQEIIKMLKIYPFKFKYYKLANRFVGELDEELQNYAVFCGVDLSRLTQ